MNQLFHYYADGYDDDDDDGGANALHNINIFEIYLCLSELVFTHTYIYITMCVCLCIIINYYAIFLLMRSHT